jgi:hypothetical protein
MSTFDETFPDYRENKFNIFQEKDVETILKTLDNVKEQCQTGRRSKIIIMKIVKMMTIKNLKNKLFKFGNFYWGRLKFYQISIFSFGIICRFEGIKNNKYILNYAFILPFILEKLNPENSAKNPELIVVFAFSIFVLSLIFISVISIILIYSLYLIICIYF